MNLRFLAMAAVVSGGLALVGCEKDDCGGGAVEGCGTAGSNTGGTGTTTDTGGGGTGGGDTGGGGTPCLVCGCETLGEGGCQELCEMDDMGTPNFCEGAPPLEECAACLATRCGVSDPKICQ